MRELDYICDGIQRERGLWSEQGRAHTGEEWEARVRELIRQLGAEWTAQQEQIRREKEEARRKRLAQRGIVKFGTKYHGTLQDSGVYYWVFNDLELSDEDIADILESEGVTVEGVAIYSPHDCTGKYFSDPIWIRRGKSRVLVTQSWGVDI
jgi:hypothetical protein